MRSGFASSIDVRIASATLAVPRTTSSSGITFAGEKKCRPMTSSGRFTEAAISSMSSVEVLVASIAPGFATRVELGEDLLLQLHALEHGFDDRRRWRPGRRTRSVPLINARRRAFSAASMRPRLTMLSKVSSTVAEPAVERGLVDVEQRHGNAGVGERDGDAAAHGAGADHAGAGAILRGSPAGRPSTLRVSRSAKNTWIEPLASTVRLGLVGEFLFIEQALLEGQPCSR